MRGADRPKPTHSSGPAASIKAWARQSLSSAANARSASPSGISERTSCTASSVAQRRQRVARGSCRSPARPSVRIPRSGCGQSYPVVHQDWASDEVLAYRGAARRHRCLHRRIQLRAGSRSGVVGSRQEVDACRLIRRRRAGLVVCVSMLPELLVLVLGDERDRESFASRMSRVSASPVAIVRAAASTLTGVMCS